MNYTENGDGTGCNEAYITILPCENGEVAVKDPSDKVVKSGTKVQKNTELTVYATPDSGYEVVSMKANGQDITDKKVIIKQATEVAVMFSLASSINGTERVVATAVGANGKILFTDTLSADTSLGFPAGIYIVTLQNGTDTVTRKLLVR